MRRAITSLASVFFAASFTTAQSIPFPTVPTYESSSGDVSTGGAFADIDLDGFVDLVVSNGNDILRQRTVVYTNQNGTFPTVPSWQSADVDYHGHLDVGDVNQDGWPDVAVAVFLGASGFGNKGGAKLYLNDGAGTLITTPAWHSADAFFCFSVSLGDADGDGDLDLAAATGEPYFDPPDADRIYLNQGGQLGTLPGWTSTEIEHALDIEFADVDQDGDLDLLTCGSQAPNHIYFSSGGLPATTAGWSSTDNNSPFGNTILPYDLDGDGHLELVVTDNNQLSGGQGLFKIYAGSATGPATAPTWSVFGGQTSALAAGDLLLDGHPDLAAGVWFGKARIFENTTGFPATSPAWQMTGSSVQESMFFADVDRAGLVTEKNVALPVNGKRLFALPHAPLQSIAKVVRDGVPLGPTDYCFSLADGWLSLKQAPTTSLSIDFVWSQSLDLGVTNWDQAKGNYVFVRRPLVDATLVSPPAVVHEGQNLAFGIEVTNTTAATLDVASLGLFALPTGQVLLIHLAGNPFTPFQTDAVNFSVAVPVGLPSILHANYTVTEYVVRNGFQFIDQESFVFSIQP